MERSHSSTLYPAWGTLSYSDIDDPNAIKTSIATAVTKQTYDGAALNGTFANPGPAKTKMHVLSVTTASNGGSYVVGSTIVFTCTDQRGKTRTLTATITNADGGETLDAVDADGNIVGAMTVSTIVVGAQADTGGAFEFGVTDVVFDDTVRQLRGGAAGDIAVEYEADLISGVVAFTDTLQCIEGERHDCFAKKILDSGTDAFPVKAYL